MDSLRGKTLRWTFTDEPVAGTLFEHTFHDDGSVVWRILEGQGKGASAHEKRYATMQVTEDVTRCRTWLHQAIRSPWC